MREGSVRGHGGLRGRGEIERALREHQHFYTSDLGPGEAHFYRATPQAPGDRATLVWNRRALGCIRPGCGTSALTLTDLDLEQIDPATGAVLSTSRSKIDNVEQVRSPAAGETIYKVKAASTVDGLPAEPYALAATRQITPLATPKPVVSLSVDRGMARSGEDVRVVAIVTNPSRDLSAQSVHVTLGLPPGVTPVPGSADSTADLGTLGPNASGVAAWTVRGTGDGLRSVTADASATRYGETFTSGGSAGFTVDGTAPTVTLKAPTGHVTDPNIPIEWSGTDAGAGVRTFDLEFSENGGPYSEWLTGTTETRASFPGARGHRYRFRVRATDALDWTSGFAESGEVAVDTGPAIHRRRDPHLVLRKVARRGALVRVRASIAARGGIPVAIDLTARDGRKKIHRRALVREAAGHLRADLHVPRRTGTLRDANVTVRFGGNAAYSGACVSRRFPRL